MPLAPTRQKKIAPDIPVSSSSVSDKLQQGIEAPYVSTVVLTVCGLASYLRKICAVLLQQWQAQTRRLVRQLNGKPPMARNARPAP